MEWGNKFSTLMKETEINLQRVKDRLSSARASPNVNLSTMNDNARIYKLTTTDNAFIGSAKPQYNDFTNATLSSNSALNTHTPVAPGIAEINYQGPHHDASNILAGTSLETSSGVFMLLYEKMDNQAKELQKLGDNMKRIEEERDQYSRQVQNLKGELAVINSRMFEKGVDLATEQKIDSWRREMMHEMQDLQSQFQYLRSRNDDLSQSTAHTDLQREIHDMKRILQSELGSIRGELETTKTRLLTLEMIMDKVTVKSTDLDHRQKRLETSVASLQQLKRTSFVSGHERKEISELRSSIRSIASKIQAIEGTVQGGAQENQRRNKYLSRPPLDSSNSSDIDLTADFSELSTADLSSTPTNKVLDEFGDLTVDTDDLLSVDDLTADLI